MAYGGQLGYSLDLGRKVPPGGYAPDGNQVRDYAQEVPEELSNVEAERGETAVGDFDQDGQMEHLKIGGKRHSEGGTALNVPPGTFIFSDTKDLKIKDTDILSAFGKSKKRGGFTPADLARQYDLNKYKSILDNPDSDPMQKRTAQMMLDNNQSKLSRLAYIQEAMKGFPQGVPNLATSQEQPQQPTAQMGGVINGQLSDPFSIYTDPAKYFMGQTSNPNTNPIYNGPVPGSMGKSTVNPVPFGFSNPDMLSMLGAAAQMSGIKKYTPYLAPTQAVTPEVNYLDPSREIAATQESANSQSMYGAYAADPKRNRTVNSSIQGQSLSNIANTLGRYNTQNTDIANRSAMMNAETANQQMMYNANRSNELYKGNVIADQQYRNSLDQGRDQMLKSYMNAWNNRSKLSMLNTTNSYFYTDPATGKLVQRTGISLTGNAPSAGPSQDPWDSYAKTVEELKRKYPSLEGRQLDAIARGKLGMGRISTNNKQTGVRTSSYGNLNQGTFYQNYENPYDE